MPLIVICAMAVPLSLIDRPSFVVCAGRIARYGSAAMLAQQVMALQTVLQRPNPL